MAELEPDADEPLAADDRTESAEADPDGTEEELSAPANNVSSRTATTTTNVYSLSQYCVPKAMTVAASLAEHASFEQSRIP